MRTPPQILIVDDNSANLDIFETRLAAHGYDIITGQCHMNFAAGNLGGKDL